MSGKHGRAKPSSRAPEPVAVGAGYSSVGVASEAPAQVAAAPTFAPPAATERIPAALPPQPVPEAAPQLAAAPPVTLGTEILPSLPARKTGALGGLMADRRRLLFAVLALVVIGLVAWLLSGGSRTSSTPGAAAAGRTQSTVPADRKATGNRVYVQNQVGTPGLGETARTKLAAAGFVYVQGQNTADMPNATAPSLVAILGPTSAQIDQGDAVARALGLPISDVRVANDGFSVGDVLVRLGADYKG